MGVSHALVAAVEGWVYIFHDRVLARYAPSRCWRLESLGLRKRLIYSKLGWFFLQVIQVIVILVIAAIRDYSVATVALCCDYRIYRRSESENVSVWLLSYHRLWSFWLNSSMIIWPLGALPFMLSYRRFHSSRLFIILVLRFQGCAVVGVCVGHETFRHECCIGDVAVTLKRL